MRPCTPQREWQRRAGWRRQAAGGFSDTGIPAHRMPPTHLLEEEGGHDDGLHPSPGSELTTCLIYQYSLDMGSAPSSCPCLPHAPHTPMHTHVQVHMRVHALVNTRAHVCACTHVHSQSHGTQGCTRMHPHSVACTRMHILTRMFTHMHTRVSTIEHTPPRVCTYTHSHNHTHAGEGGMPH